MASPDPGQPELVRRCASVHEPAGQRAGLLRRLARWWEERLVRRALIQAGEPNLVLDLPCGDGRFWPVLAEHGNRVILAADHSADLLAQGLASQPAEVVARIRQHFQTPDLAIDLHDNSVDSIFCMRLLQRFVDREQRLAMLRELHRVTRDTLIVSLWVDGNYQAWRRQRWRPGFVSGRKAIEAEFRQVGFAILGHHNFLPGCAMHRVYVLRKED